MSNLVISSGVSTGAAASSATTSRRPTAAPAPTSSPSGIRGPRMIMQERAAREARQKAEAELQAMERSRVEQEARLMEESRRRAERRTAGASSSGQGGVTTELHRPLDPRLGQAFAGVSQSQRGAGTTAQATQIPPQQGTSHIPAGQHSPPQAPAVQDSQEVPQQAGDVRSADSALPGLDGSKSKTSFPHAFERWEILSAHWEGLTSYWIRKLEQNKEEISRDPMSQQLARQVTDLSAAGANLFHAVVELQRLRASSERKFQRWFFETRSELERAYEVNGMLEAALDRERREREQAIREAVDHERGVSKTQKQIVEMRKELSISKEEARRAWEELGRREQEERDRTFSLQSGQPTIVGGVQVVPMTQNAPSRHGSTREHGSYQSEYTTTRPAYSIDQQAAQASQAQAQAQAQQTQASPRSVGGGAGSSSAQYQSHDPSQHDPSHQTGEGSEGGYSEGEYLIDADGNFVLDMHGKRIALAVPPSSYAGSDVEVDDYDTPATTGPPSGGLDSSSAPAAAGGAPPAAPSSSSSAQGQWTGSGGGSGSGAGGGYSNPQDYSGQGYGGTGWESVPRHHHPTRLSDVIEEEDERSRTSGSQRRG